MMTFDNKPIDDIFDHTIKNPLDNDNVTTASHNVQTLELLEERANVITDKVIAGKVVVSKSVRTRTVDVPVELQEEILTIQVAQGDDTAQAMLTGNYDDKDVIAHFDDTLSSVVSINGKPLAVGESVDIVLSRQVAIVTKKTHAVEEVALHTYTDTKTHTLTTELRREELEVVGESYLDDDNNKLMR